MDTEMTTQARFILLAALFAMLGVAMGAFAAHGLKAVLPVEALATIKTGVLYQLLHAIAVVVVATLMQQDRWLHVHTELRRACICFLFGVVFFSGSLYLLVLASLKVLGPVTPLGGILLLLGWMWLMIAAWKIQQSPTQEETEHNE
jgi:uncharacterized membrane protein YgdD (TMEM256/DUF423 family)